MLLPLFCAISLAAQDKAPAPVLKPDRSGEPVLRELLRDMGGLRRTHIEILKYSRSSGQQVMSKDKAISLYYAGPDRFRVLESGAFGDASMVVNDGTQVLSDPLDDTQPPTLKSGAKNIYSADEQLAFKGDGCSLLFYMLSGEPSFDTLVAKDSPVTAGPGWVTFKSANLGSVKVEFSGQEKAERVVHIQYDNLPFMAEQHKKYPDWVPEPQDPLTTEDITYSNERLDSGLFLTTPPNGRPFTDLRKKKQ